MSQKLKTKMLTDLSSEPTKNTVLGTLRERLEVTVLERTENDEGKFIKVIYEDSKTDSFIRGWAPEECF